MTTPKHTPVIETLEGRTLLTAYFVAPTGFDGANGDATHPWRSLQRAADVVKPGDVVTVRKGAYAGFVLSWDGPQGGTKSNPITFKAEKGVVINSRNAETPDGINLEPGSHYVVIKGFRVLNTSGTITRAGIRVAGSDHVVVRGNVTDRNGTWGIFTGFADDIVIRDNVASRSQVEHGIYFSNSADRARILRNRVFSNNANGIHINSDASQGGDGVISNVLVSGNVIYDNGRAGGSGINCDGVQNSRIENNLLSDNHASGISLYRIDGAQGAKNNTVVNNTILMASDARWAINIKNGSTGNRLLNNILYNNHPFRGSINIVQDSLQGFVSDYNVLMSRFSTNDGDSVLSLAQWRSATGQDLHSRLSTPGKLFASTANDNYQLSPTSPALNRGTTTLAPKVDLLNKRRPSGAGIDIGAYELQVTA